jgi:hypothetical protein
MRTLVVTSAALFVVSALAVDRPSVHPSHDVAVTYRIQTAEPNGATAIGTIQMYWTSQGTLLRLDSQNNTGYMLIDYAASQMTLILYAQKVALNVSFDPHLAPGLNIPPDATITRSGADTVAGTPCTEWTMQAAQYAAHACITQDGLVLRLGRAAHAPPALEAVSVSYGHQPPSLFSIPPGYKQIMAPAR